MNSLFKKFNLKNSWRIYNTYFRKNVKYLFMENLKSLMLALIFKIRS